MMYALFWEIMQPLVVFLYTRFGTTYQSIFFFSDSLPLKMGLIVCPVTFVKNCHYMLHNFQEEHRSQQLGLYHMSLIVLENNLVFLII